MPWRCSTPPCARQRRRDRGDLRWATFTWTTHSSRDKVDACNLDAVGRGHLDSTVTVENGHDACGARRRCQDGEGLKSEGEFGKEQGRGDVGARGGWGARATVDLGQWSRIGDGFGDCRMKKAVSLDERGKCDYMDVEN